MTFADAIQTWGKRAVKRILSMTRKYGVLCSSGQFVSGNLGKG